MSPTNAQSFDTDPVSRVQWNRWMLRETSEEQVSFWRAIERMHCGLIDTSMHFPGWLDRTVKALSSGASSVLHTWLR